VPWPPRDPIVPTGQEQRSCHPIEAAAAVWIQAGLGLWLLVAAEGWWSPPGGLASVVWGVIVWAFGGIFAPGLTWLFRRTRCGTDLCGGRGADRPARPSVGRFVLHYVLP
jgi:hypothetical protein